MKTAVRTCGRSFFADKARLPGCGNRRTSASRRFAPRRNFSAKLRRPPHPCPPCVKGGWRAQRGGGIDCRSAFTGSARKTRRFDNPSVTACAVTAPFTQGSQRANQPFRGNRCAAPSHKGLPDRSGSQYFIRGRALPPRAPPLLRNRDAKQRAYLRQKSPARYPGFCGNRCWHEKSSAFKAV